MYELTPDPSGLWTLLTQVEVIHKISGAWKVPADLLRRLDDRATSEVAAEERYISVELYRLFASSTPNGLLTWFASFEIIENNDLVEPRMAGNLHVRNLDEDLIARLKRRAARHGRSTEAEHREILRQALLDEVEPSFDTLAAELRKLTRRRKQTPLEVLLRQGREDQ